MSPWWWLVAILVVLALIALGIYLWQRRRARARMWRDELARTLPDVQLTRNLLDETSGEVVQTSRLDTLHRQTDDNAVALNKLAQSAPDADARAAATAAEQALRGWMSAIDAEQLLRTGADAPARDALRDVAARQSTHAHALDSALSQLDAIVNPDRVTNAAAG